MNYCLSFIAHCIACSASDTRQCQQCESGYVLANDGSQCVQQRSAKAISQDDCMWVLHCTECSALDPKMCGECFAAYRPSEDGMACVLKESACQGYDNMDNKCLYCYYETGLFEGQCHQCQQGCANCTFARTESGIVETCLSCCKKGDSYEFSEEGITFTYQCPQQQNFTNDNGRCVNCKSFGDQCLMCNPSRCTLCETGYFLDAAGECQPCGQYCIACDITGCQQCQQYANEHPVYLESGICFLCSDEEKYGPFCKACTLSQCTSCEKEGYSLIDGKCQQCPTFCLSCSSVTQCTQCNSGYHLSGGVCYDCSESKYGQNCVSCNSDVCTACSSQINQTIINGKCTSCEENCVSCQGKQCLACAPGFFLHQGDCYNCSLPMYGIQCSECGPTDCLACSQNGFSVIDGTCQQCSNLCDQCDASGCKQCVQQSKVHMHENHCYDCSLPQYGEFCLTCSATECLSCASYDKIGLINGKCTNCTENCQYCDSTGCTKCVSQSYVQLINKTCIDCHIYGEYCDDCTIGQCTVCNMDGFGINSNGHCEECSDNCISCSNDSCDDCIPGYYTSNGVCVECGANCKLCTSERCTECVSNQYAVNGTVCQLCGTIYSKHCNQCTNDNCTNCSSLNDGVSFVSGVCIECQEGCLRCNNTQCIECKAEHYELNGQCKKCEEKCTECNQKECIKCYAGFSLHNGLCYDCNDAIYGENCMNCTDTQCVACKEMNGTANAVINGKCQNCGPNCLSCDESGCLECDRESEGVSLVNGTCIDCSDEAKYGSQCRTCNNDACETCMPDISYNVTGGKCQECPAYCASCENNVCTSCKATQNGVNYILKDGLCKTCQSLYGPFCLENSCNNETCTECKDQDIGMSIASTGECLDCHEYHEQCEKCDKTKCLKCPDKYTITSKGCEQCPLGCWACMIGEAGTLICIPLDHVPDVPDVPSINCSDPANVNNSHCIDFPDIDDPTNDTNRWCTAADYTIINGRCVKCNSKFGDYCDRCTPEGCTRCSDRVSATHWVADGFCNNCGEKKYGSLCKECDKQRCLACNPNCPDCYITDEGQCQHCGAGCKVCNSQECQVCDKQDNTVYMEGKVCLSCVSPCRTCSSKSKCLSCINDDYYLASNGSCTLCTSLPYCQTCSADGQCTACITSENDQFSLYEGRCLQCNVLYNESCSACDDKECLGCKQGYYLTEEKQCEKCPPNCRTCEIIEQLMCTGCENLDNGISLIEGRCIDCRYIWGAKCKECSLAQCTSCPEEGFSIYPNGSCSACPKLCSQCNGFNCTACAEDYYSLVLIDDTQACINCQRFGPQCVSCNVDGCLLCNNANMFVNNDGLCQICAASCQTCEVAASNCTSCYNQDQGTSLIENECFDCHAFGNCNSCTKTTCLECQGENYYINNGICVPCQDNCKTCNINGCFECYNQNNGVSLVGNRCVDCSLSKFGYGCKECDNNHCLSCMYDDYFLDAQQRCQQCSAYCQKCEDVNGHCVQCLEDPDISFADNQCVNCTQFGTCESCGVTTCLECKQTNQYIRAGQCMDCSENCARCDAADNCLECVSSEHTISLYNGYCHVCPANCASCISTLICSQCEPGYITVNGNCAKCEPPCLTCTNSVSRCLTCIDDYSLNATDNKCYGCDVISNCKECTVVNNNLMCAAGMCEDGYQQTQQLAYDQQCIHCPYNCLNCSSQTFCTLCADGFAANELGVCERCQDKVDFCNTCVYNMTAEEIYCLPNGCSSPYHLFEGQCIRCSAANCQQCVHDQPYKCEVCDSGEMAPINGICTPCNQLIRNCKLCEIADQRLICTQCNDTQYSLSADKQLCGNCNGIMFCKACDSANPQLCQQCENSYKLENQQRECNIWDGKECAIFNTMSKECMRCGHPNMHLIATVCYHCKQDKCETCLSDLTTCTKCHDEENFYIENGVCKAYCRDPNCIQCDVNRDVCQKCETSYVEVGGVCYRCPDHCLYCEEDKEKCSKCEDGQLLSQDGKCGSCSEVIEHCTQCIVSDGIAQCVQCEHPFLLDQDNKCTDSCQRVAECKLCHEGHCVECNVPYIYDQESSTCINSNSSCKEYDQDSKLCTECDDDSYKDTNGLCKPCAGKYPLCSKCDISECSECVGDNILSDDKLFCGNCHDIENCDLCQIIDPNLCQKCNSPYLPSPDGRHCYNCTSDANCLFCLSESQCYNCSNDMIPFNNSGHCVQKCDIPHCVLCIGDRCAVCEKFYATKNGECIYDGCSQRINDVCVDCTSNYELTNGLCSKKYSPTNILLLVIAIIVSILTITAAIIVVVKDLKIKKQKGMNQSQSTPPLITESSEQGRRSTGIKVRTYKGKKLQKGLI